MALLMEESSSPSPVINFIASSLEPSNNLYCSESGSHHCFLGTRGKFLCFFCHAFLPDSVLNVFPLLISTSLSFSIEIFLFFQTNFSGTLGPILGVVESCVLWHK